MMDVRVLAYHSLQFDADEELSDRLMDEFAPLSHVCIRVRARRDYPVPAGDYCVYAIKGWSNPEEGASPRMVELLLSPASEAESSRRTLVDFEEVVRRYERAQSA